MTLLQMFLAAITSPEPVQRALWEVVLVVLGGISVSCGVAVIIWKIAKPHVERFVKSIVAPLQETADAVHAQVKPNGGESAHDYAKKAYQAASEARAASLDTQRLAHRNIRKIDSVESKLDGHIEEGRRYFDHARQALQAQGVNLPEPD